MVTSNRVIGIDIRKIQDFGIGTYTTHLLQGLAASSDLPEVVYRLYHDSCYQPDPRIFPPTRFPVVNIPAGKRSPLQGSLPGKLDLAAYHAPHYLTPDPGSIPLILTVHDCIHLNPPPFPESFDRLGNQSDLLFDAAKRYYHKGQGLLRFKKLVKQAREIITVSDATTQDLLNLIDVNPQKITRIYNCINDAFFEELKLDDTDEFCMKYNLQAREYFLYCGNDLYHKNLAGLLTAWKYLNMETEAPALVLAGPPRQLMIKEFAESLGIQDKIILLDRVPANNLRCLYHGSKGLIMPSLAEGFGLPVAEAMAMKVPVICSDIPVLKEITNGHAFFFNPYQPPDIVKTVKEFIADSDQKERNVINARETALTYSRETFVSSHLQVYNRVLEELV